MEEGAPLEGCQMSDTSLTAVEVARRVTYTVAAWFTVANLNWVKMHPTRGYVSLVSMTTLPVLFPSSMVSSSITNVVSLLGAGEDGEGFRAPVLEDRERQERNCLFAEEQKQKKDTMKRKRDEVIRAREALEKHHRQQARDGLPQEESPFELESDDEDFDIFSDEEEAQGFKGMVPP
jgi:hypothetical protein